MTSYENPLTRETLHKLEKMFLHDLAIVFLGFVVSTKGLEVDPNKVKAILEWPIPSTL